MIKENGVQGAAGKEAASVHGLRLKYPGQSKLIFKDLSLSVQQGERLLLLGPSGCGKSTLLQVLSGIMPGLVEVPMSCEERNTPSSWGIVFQDPDTQFCMSYVDEELAFVLENRQCPPEGMKVAMHAALSEVGLELEELHIPISTLSQGMKQRLALASVLLLEPEVIFLDEPSSMLDPEGRKLIWESVERIAHRRTLVIVEHRIEEMIHLVSRAVIFGMDGTLLGEGPPDELFERYHAQLQQYGIWYPGVWSDYMDSRSGRWLQEKVHIVNRQDAKPVISLRQFQGLRSRLPAVTVEQADIYAGDFIAVTGPNGAGKSTLLQCLIRLLPSQGGYELAGESVAHSGKKRSLLSKQFGFCFQNPELQFICSTVLDEMVVSFVSMGMDRDEAENMAEGTLERIGLNELQGRHPYQLSIGQKRRLSVAAAIVGNQPVLLLDEPTFGQDARNTFALLEWCEELRRSGVVIMMVTHEPIIADRFATQIWMVHNGRVISQAVTDRLKSDAQLEGVLVQ